MVVAPPGEGGSGTSGGEGSSAGGPAQGAGIDTPWCRAKAVIADKCWGCHNTQLAGGAPFPLATYADLTADDPMMTGKKVYERVAVRIDVNKAQAEGKGPMPPSGSLGPSDLAAIKSWIAAGAPEGENPTCTGTSADPAAGSGAITDNNLPWPLPDCDATYKIVSHGPGGPDDPFIVPAHQEIHPQVNWDAPWGDEQVQAIGIKSITDNSKVLHHWILYAQGGGFLVGWAPGEDGIKPMADDIGENMPSGRGSLRLDMHYFNTNGDTDEPDNSGVEICVVKKEHFRKNAASVTMQLAGLPVIPPNSVNFDVTGKCTVSGNSPVTLLSAAPHGHTYARHMKFTVKRATGEEIVMLDQPFMFGEQHSYALDPPIVVKKGDVITTTCTYTNTTNKTVTLGESTTDEMCFNFAMYYPANQLNCGLGGLLGGGGFLGGN